MPIVKDIELRSGDANQSILIDDLTVTELPVVELGQIPKHPQWHIGVPRTLMFHQDDIAVANAEADIVLDVVVEYTAQRRDTDVLWRDGFTCQCLIEAGQALLVIEDMPEKRIFIRPFSFHVIPPFSH